jgi:hypothetical protein
MRSYCSQFVDLRRGCLQPCNTSDRAFFSADSVPRLQLESTQVQALRPPGVKDWEHSLPPQSAAVPNARLT